MNTWRVEYETAAGIKTLDVAADKVLFTSGRVEFYRNNDLVAWLQATAVIAATAFPGRLAEGGIVKRSVPWRRRPEDEEEIFVPGTRENPYRMRFDSDPIGDAAREAAKRFEPKVTSADVDRSTEARWVQGSSAAVDIARGELGGRCA